MWILKDQAEIRNNNWVTKLDGSIVCPVGEEHKVLFLEQLGISTYIQSSGSGVADIGFAPFTKTWYAWKDYRVTRTCGVDEIKNDYEHKSRWETFGFSGALRRIME
jgi:rubredoxin